MSAKILSWLPFNSWSQKRINLGLKFCTSRTKEYPADSRVLGIVQLPLGFVRDHLFRVEGAGSPKEFEEVWLTMHKSFDANKLVYVHFGDFRKDESKTVN